MSQVNDPFTDVMTSRGTIDIRKLLSKLAFPVHAIDSPFFHLAGFSPVFQSYSNDPTGGFYKVSLTFCSPNYKDRSQVVIITTHMRPPWDSSLDIESALATQLFNNLQYLPAGFRMPLEVAPSNSEPFYQFLKNITWQTRVLSGLEFQLFHLNLPAYFSVACSNLNNGFLFVESVGVSHAEFLKTLDKIIPLQQSEKLIVSFQDELLVRRRESEQELGDQ
jgi:hypothetical protein